MSKIWKDNTFWIVRRNDLGCSPCYYAETLSHLKSESIEMAAIWVKGCSWFGKNWKEMRNHGFECVKVNMDIAVNDTANWIRNEKEKRKRDEYAE